MTTPEFLVFSDVDETIINRKTMFELLDSYFAGRHGPEGAVHARATRLAITALTVGFGGVSRYEANREYYRAWAGESVDEVSAWGARWYAECRVIDDFFVPGTRAELDRHRECGAVLVLITGSLAAVTEPVATEVGADVLACTRQEVADSPVHR
jgi:phosphoserine phosphatase